MSPQDLSKALPVIEELHRRETALTLRGESRVKQRLGTARDHAKATRNKRSRNAEALGTALAAMRHLLHLEKLGGAA